jgi:hypothetical protein
MRTDHRPKTAQCWGHGCNGRVFAHYSDLYRHQRSMGTCPRCSERNVFLNGRR